MKELELKLLIDEATAGDIWKRAEAVKLCQSRPRSRRIETTYVDTPDQCLRNAGLTLRLRRDGRRSLQTVKSAPSLHGGLSDVVEVETVLPKGQLDLAAIPDEGLRDKIVGLVKGAALKPVSTMVVRRAEGTVSGSNGTTAMLAVDVAEVVAGKHLGKFFELELEHIKGSPAGLFDIARQLLPEGGVTFSALSKAQRGDLLAETGKIVPKVEPRNAQVVGLSKGMTAEQAAQQVLRECAVQIAENIHVVRRLPVPEGPHQLRIGLRRLRSALLIFRPLLDSPAVRQIGSEAQWLGQQVGRLRDLDVIINDIIQKEATAHPEVSGFNMLSEALKKQAEEVRHQLRNLLAGGRVQSFLFDLMKFIETRGWINVQDVGQTSKLAIPIVDLAAIALEKRWNKASSCAKGIQTLSVEERHALRKELKKLRYAVEFLSPLYSAKKVKPFLANLKNLQDIFGDLNDAAMIKAALIEGELQLEVQQTTGIAIGWVAGASSARADVHWENAKRLWKNLRKTPKFWG
jgi:triphosphatase